MTTQDQQNRTSSEIPPKTDDCQSHAELDSSVMADGTNTVACRQSDEGRGNTRIRDGISPDRKKVFIIHGRNLKAREEMGVFVRSLGLAAINFEDLRASMGGSPTIAEIVQRGMSEAQGVIALFTPDEFATLSPEFRDKWRSAGSDEARFQARPNVIFEAGMAFGRDRNRVVFVLLGNVSLFTDVAGIHVLRPKNDPTGDRATLRDTLITGMACDGEQTGREWMTSGDFETCIDSKVRVARKSAGIRRTAACVFGGAALVVGVAVASLWGREHSESTKSAASASAIAAVRERLLPKRDAAGTITNSRQGMGGDWREVSLGNGSTYRQVPVFRSDCTTHLYRWVVEGTQGSAVRADPIIPNVGKCPPGMAAVSGGTFALGEMESPINSTVKPALVTVQPFCLDLTEVTSAAYEICVRLADTSKRCKKPDEIQCDGFATVGRPSKRKHPVNCVTWGEAAQYCIAQSKRLPTEEEWEWAARRQEKACDYPWGKAEPGSQACWGPTSEMKGTCPVGTFPAGDAPGGIHDLAGNVAEWTESREKGHLDASVFIIRGDDWSCQEGTHAPCLLSSNRKILAGTHRSSRIGFRCAL